MTFWGFLNSIGGGWVTALALIFLIAIVAIVTYLVAAPGKEVSLFLGLIKFHKRPAKFKAKASKKPPKPLPEEWERVLMVFLIMDSSHISETYLIDTLFNQYGSAELSIRNVLEEMRLCGLVSLWPPTITLNHSIYPLLQEVEKVVDQEKRDEVIFNWNLAARVGRRR